MSNKPGPSAARARRSRLPATQREEIRTSHRSLLEPSSGTVARVRLGTAAFRDAGDGLATIPEVFLGRSFIVADRTGVKAVCRRAGTVYALARSDGPLPGLLIDAGFAPINIPAFRVFEGDTADWAAYQKHLADGEVLSFGGELLLLFGAEERGGVPDSQMRSLVPPVFLPDGTEFKTWEVVGTHSATLYVDQAHPRASDDNPGSEAFPFKTIDAAAQVLQPGERVVVRAGVYRERVNPARGGTDPEHMITYEAEPGATVVISGAEMLDLDWVRSAPYIADQEPDVEPTVDRLWMARLPAASFPGYNPFAVANYRQMMNYWKLGDLFTNDKARLFFQVVALLFQDGKRLEQVDYHNDLYTKEGAFWVETDGLTIHVSPYGGTDPAKARWEATAREQIFAPEAHHLGYIKVSGFTMEYAANSFPFPQHGALSTTMGHHWLIVGNTIRWANSIGIDIGNQGYPSIDRPDILGYHILRGNTLEDIGITGVTGPGPHDSLIEDNVFRRNAWHDVEFLAECAAIKTHQNQNVVMRRNLVLDTLHGTGIYIDYQNSNTRICQNVIVNTGTENGPGPGEGGIYIEHALEPVMVDHNVVWGSTRTNGIYAYQSSKLTIAHNMVGGCQEAGIWVLDMVGRGSVSGGNTILNNIVVDNGWSIGVYTPRDNVSDHNLVGHAREDGPFRLGLSPDGYRGYPPPRKGTVYAKRFTLDAWQRAGFDRHSAAAEISATFDPETLALSWSVRGEPGEGAAIDGIAHDFWGRPTDGEPIVPGPFGVIPTETQRIVVDPRPVDDGARGSRQR